MNNEEKKLKEQHIKNYKNYIIELIKTNNDSLFDVDIKSLLEKPPLDSMDNINNKFLTLAKKYKIVLDSKEIHNLLEKFRKEAFTICNLIKKERIDYYNNLIEKFSLDKNETIKILKKDTNVINKKIKSKFKKLLLECIDSNFTKNLDKIFLDKTDDNIKDKLKDELYKFIKNNYSRQLLDSFDIKILIKDTILINSCNEENEKYLFTCNNSHLFD